MYYVLRGRARRNYSSQCDSFTKVSWQPLDIVNWVVSWFSRNSANSGIVDASCAVRARATRFCSHARIKLCAVSVPHGSRALPERCCRQRKVAALFAVCTFSASSTSPSNRTSPRVVQGDEKERQGFHSKWHCTQECYIQANKGPAYPSASAHWTRHPRHPRQPWTVRACTRRRHCSHSSTQNLRNEIAIPIESEDLEWHCISQ